MDFSKKSYQIKQDDLRKQIKQAAPENVQPQKEKGWKRLTNFIKNKLIPDE